MQVWPKALVFVTALSAFVAPAFAEAPDSYEVSATLSHAGKPFAAPSAIVKSGQPASIESSGADGYKITLTVTDAGPDKIQVIARVTSRHGSMAPTVTVQPEKPAKVAVGDLGLELVVRPRGG